MIRVLATLLLLSLSSAAAWSQALPLHFGLFPNLSAPVLLAAHQPLADYLSHALKRPVYLETAPDFASFVNRTRQGRYDLLLTAPHLAYLAHAQAGYRPLYAYANPIRGMLVVRTRSPFRKLTDLEGKTIAMADPLAIVVMMMEADLRQAGLLEGRDFARLEAGSHNNAALLVAQGKAEGGVLGVLPYRQLPAKVRRELRPLALTKPVLSQVYLASPGLPDADIAALSLALKGFGDTAAGRKFFRRGALGGLVSISADSVQPFRPYGAEAIRRLEGRQP